MIFYYHNLIVVLNTFNSIRRTFDIDAVALHVNVHRVKIKTMWIKPSAWR